jgi:hypothetical protein
VGDCCGKSPGRLPDQEDLQEAGEQEGNHSLHSITVFVRYENVVRLLEFLGYRLE